MQKNRMLKRAAAGTIPDAAPVPEENTMKMGVAFIVFAVRAGL